MDKMDGKTMDIVAENVGKLKELFPEAFTEGKVDFDALKEVLGSFVDDRDERYSFTWNGKSKARMIAQTPSTGTLRPCKDESADWETTQNIFIEGDNLEVLKLLQKTYHKKVKMIYIDPPYNTGKDFVYKDNFKDNIKNYKEITGQVDGEGRNLSNNPETSGRYHTDWLNMMYPRLKLARNLLKDDGVIFISIDENEFINLRHICNEIFGEENHIASMTVINNMKGRNDKANIATSHEYLLIYSKGGFESLGLPLTEEQLKDYKYTDENANKYALRDLRKRGRPDRREDRPNMYFPIFYSQLANTCLLTKTSEDDIEILPKRGDGSDGRWRWGKDRVSNNLAFLQPRYSKKKNRWDIDHRVYLSLNVMDDSGDEEADDGDENFTRTSKSKSFWWGGDISTDVANREFKRLFSSLNPDYPKSPFMIEKLLHMSVGANDIVLDFFAGYSTTGDAVYRFNKEKDSSCKYLLVQLPEPFEEDKKEHKEAIDFCKNNGLATNIAEISKERIRRAVAKIKEENPEYDGDLGFKVFKLDSTNIKPWEVDFDMTERTLEDLISNIKHDRREEDVLYEVLLKYGLDLTLPITEHSIAGKKVFDIGMGALIICLADFISLEVVEGMAKRKEELNPEIMRVVFKDSGFKDDVVKTNAVQILKQAGIFDVRSL
jgi:adenine-specific DNA-methyltransferase